MGKPSSQKFIGRNRAPRVQIEYDVELYGAVKKVQIPFVMGVMSDLSGDAKEALVVPGRRTHPARPVFLECMLQPFCQLGISDSDEHLIEDDIVDDFYAVESVETFGEATRHLAAAVDEISDA